MHKHNIVDDLNLVAKVDEKCVECQTNKCTRATHHKRSTPRADIAGSVLHIDTAGPFRTPSVTGSKYMVLCKDEASNYRQVVFVTEKSKVANKVKGFISKATLETGNQVLKIVTDNGSEYVNHNLGAFLEQRGILHEKSVPYAPEQNGFVERDMRTIKQAARTMLNSASLKEQLWATAVDTAVYVVNRVVTSSNKMVTPYEAWFGTKPSVKNLHVYGEMAVLRRPNSQRDSAWSERGIKAVFVGYTERFNTFRFWIPEQDKFTVSCDAVFVNEKHNGDKIVPEQVSYDSKFESVTVQKGDEQTSFHQGVDEDVQYEGSQPDLDNSGENFTDAPGDQAPSSNVSGIDICQSRRRNEQIMVDVRNIATGVKGYEGMPLEEARRFVNENANRVVSILHSKGITELRIGDLTHNTATGRWKDSTGVFISRAHINAIKDKLDESQCRQGNVACAFYLASQVPIPQNHGEAMASDFSAEWAEAMEDEMASLVENQLFSEIPKSQASKRPVGSRWVYTVKAKPSGKIEKFKARVVARGFTQAYGIDFTETYCSVVQIMSTRLVLSYAARMDLNIRQFDIKTASSYGQLQETIFMDPPEGYGSPDKVWLLNRSLYGLKQSPRMWNKRFSNVLSDLGLQVSKYDQSVFYQLNPLVIVIVYVDDGLILSREDTEIVRVLDELKSQFKMRELEVNVYRGLQIEIMNDGIFVHQSSYTKRVLQTFLMDQSRPSNNPVAQVDSEETTTLQDKPYRSVVGSLAYLADTSRPDIAFAVNRLARQMSSPTENSWRKAKQVLRYLVDTTNLEIWYPKKSEDQALIGYSDSDFAGDQVTSKSTTGYVILTNGAPIHWKTQLQRHVTLSSTEAEVIALCALSKELAWIRRFMIELNMINEIPAIIKCDNESAIKIACSEKATLRTRHLRAQDAYVREQIELGELKLVHVRSEWQLADMLTKMLQTGKFLTNRNMLLANEQRDNDERW